ncbi:MAG: hypothetical protein AB1758_12240 [Candidatus Eremiobacterota bacterium]
MICVIIGILGMAFLGKRAGQYRAVLLETESARAYELAMAGLESVRVKLNKDLSFPPVGEADQDVYSYTESVYDLDGTTLLGSYEVAVDSTWCGVDSPYRVLRVRVTGNAMAASQVTASRELLAEFDMRPGIPGPPPGPNPNYTKIINLQDSGSL